MFSALLLVGVTVAVAAAASDRITPQAEPPDATIPKMGLAASGEMGLGGLGLLHTGGEPLDLGEVTVTVTIGGEAVQRGPAGTAGEMWFPGETLQVEVPAGIPAGANVEVTLTHEGGAATLATSSFTIPDAATQAAAQSTFALNAALSGGSPLALEPGSTFRFDATVSHSEGRKYLRYVYADLSGLGGPTWVDLFDDGTHGDLVASDGIFGAMLALPSGAPPGPAVIAVHAVDLDGHRSSFELHVAVAAPVLPTPPAPPAPPSPPPVATPPFTIDPDGGVRPRCAGPMELRVVGVDITYGATGPRIPVRAQLTLNDGVTMTPLFGGAPVAQGMNMMVPVTTADVVGVRGQANYLTFNSAYRSWVADPHVEVLKNGDLPPDVPAFGTQTAIEVYLAPYVENGKMKLANDEAILLFEFVSNLSSPAADFQDLVVLLRFTEC